MTPEPASRRPRARWRRYLPFLGLLLLAWIVSRLDGSRVRAALGEISGGAVALACAWFSLNMGLKAWRWHRLLAAQRLPLPLDVAFATFLAAQFYGQVTLGRVGELFRAEALTERGVPLGKALSSSVFDRVLDLGLVVALASVLGAFVVGETRAALAALVVLAALAVAAWLAARLPPREGSEPRPASTLERLLSRLPAGARLAGGVRSLLDGVQPLLEARHLLEAWCWTCAGWFGYLLALWTLADGMAIDASRLLLTTVAMLAALSSLLPVTVSGLGARELIYMQLLGDAGVPSEAAVVLALLHLGVMSVCAVGLGALGIWARARQGPPAAPMPQH